MSELSRLAEWAVPPDEIDHIDHMGTGFYAYRAEQGALVLIESLLGSGSGAEPLRVVDLHIRYRREQRRGARLRMAGGVTRVGDPAVEVYIEISNAETGDLAATFNMQLEGRRRGVANAMSFSADQLARLGSQLATPPPGSLPRSLPTEKLGLNLRLEDLRRAGIHPHATKTVLAADCDADGFLKKQRPVYLEEDHIPQVGVMAKVWVYQEGYFWPMIEQRDVRFHVPRRGDIIHTYEALLGLHGKVIHSANWLFEASSETLCEVRHMVTVFFDARTRTAASLSPDLRTHLIQLARPDLLASASTAPG